MPRSEWATRLKRFLVELRRRKVYRVGAVYVVMGFAVAQGAEYLFEMAGLPVVASRAVAIVLLLGLPVALVLAWAYEVRPEESTAARPGDGKDDAPGTEGVHPASEVLPAPSASIVVLPFDNISPDPADAYFADGLTEEITATLAGLRDLRVTSRTSATVLKEARKDARTIAAELSVAYVLEGSVRKAGDALRVTAQLIRAETDEHLWSERYDGALADVFGMQEQVARSIARALELHLEPAEEHRLATRPMSDPKAYESYLRAREASLRWTREAMEEALGHLEAARARVGDNAVVLAGIGYVYSQFSNMGAHDRDYVALAEEHARKALELDPDNPEAHMVLGFLYQAGLDDLDRSVQHLERSLEVKPDDPHALLWLTMALSLVGRNEEMSAAAARLNAVDPLAPMSRAMLAYARQVRGDHEGALEPMRLYHRDSPTGAASLFWAHSLALVDRNDAALAVLRGELQDEPDETFARLGHLLRGALEGDADRMDAAENEQLRERLAHDPQFAFYAASIYARGGRRDDALRWLRSAVAGGFRNHPWMAEHDPWLAPYRDDPDFRAVFEEVREAWQPGRSRPVGS